MDPGDSDTRSWLLVLPDSAAARSVQRAAGRPTRLVTHPSGRPWILGSWPEGLMSVGRVGRTSVAVIGQHSASVGRLTLEASRIQSVADLDRLAASLAGSWHLIASVDGQVRVQGTVTGIRRVFHAAVGGVPVAADRADVLAALSRSDLDEQRLALHLLHPHVLYPLAGLPVWRGVDVLQGDHYLVLDGDGRRRQVRWWTAPEPALPMTDGAPALRAALSEAVGIRVKGRDLVSCDLGGLDSTAVCCVAALGRAKVAAYTAASPDPLADDVAWAERTVAALGDVEHHVISAEDMPLVFHGLGRVDGQVDGRFDEPCSAAVDRDRWLIIARHAAERGSRLHLTGFGGDELLYGSVAHLHDLLRTSPRIAVRSLRGFSAKYRWSRRSALRQLSDSRPYAEWLRTVADTLTAPRPPSTEPLLEWGFRPRLPPWASPDAVASVRAQIRAESRAVEPLARRRGQQRELETMRFLSRMTRQFDQMAGRMGVTLAAPYYDDRVVEAGLAVRPEDRVTPWRYKPLIVEATRGIVPEDSLTRQTKANGSGDEEPGMRRHRAELLALWEDSRLGRLGLIDAAAVREACTRPLPPRLQFGVLDQVVACEVWLRSLESSMAILPS